MRLLALVLCMALVACTGDASSTPPTPGVLTPEEVFANAEELSYNPLTGEPLAEGALAGQRPVAVMVNNARAGLPQRGIAAADAMVEMVTEGGITRLMALYANPAAMPQVGPVRSARDQHLQLALPINAVVMHIGTSIYAENMLSQYTYQTLDGRYLGAQVYQFDEARAATYAYEHCWFTDAALLQTGMGARSVAATGKSYPLLPFATEGKTPTTPAEGDAPDTRVSFAADSVVQFTFDSASGLYKKMAYGAPHLDETTGEQLAFRNVLVLFAATELKPDAYCTDYNFSSGHGYYLFGGKYQKILWSKGNPEQPLLVTDLKGKELAINPGKTYLGVVPADFADTLVLDVNAPAEPAESTSQPAVPE